jgi:hypothetical protein
MAQEVGRQHRRDEPRRQQRKQDLHRYGDAELLEELAAMPGRETRSVKIATMVRLMAMTARPIVRGVDAAW